MEDFLISIRDIKQEFYTGVLTGTIAEKKSLLERIFNSAYSVTPKDEANQSIPLDSITLYNVKDQTYIPHFAMNFQFSKMIWDETLKITDIFYPKVGLTPTSARSIGNNIRTIMDFMFNNWMQGGPGRSTLLKTSFVKSGQNYTMYIAPGMLLDSEGKVLFSLVYKKELITRLNSIPGLEKITDFYSLFNETHRATQGISFEKFLNENALLFFSKRFTEATEYSRFYKTIRDTLVNGVRYEIDTVISNDIDKHIYNLPSDIQTEIFQFSSLQEKKEFCRTSLKEALLT